MFFIIFIAFAVLGYLLFGTVVETFSSFGSAMFTLLRTILGDFNYTEIEQANKILAPLFFLSYIFFVFFILLVINLIFLAQLIFKHFQNMFIAIINETYADVKADIAKAVPLSFYVKKFVGSVMRIGSLRKDSQYQMKPTRTATVQKVCDVLAT